MLEEFNFSALVALTGHKSNGQQIDLHLVITALLPTVLATRNLGSIPTASKLKVVALGVVFQYFGSFTARALSDHFVSSEGIINGQV